MFGFLNIYKPVGMTSHDVVAVLRKITKIKQIGHTGTLDPFAQGVLPVAIGKAARLIEFLDDEKEYLAEVAFGKSTDTYDCEGSVISEIHSEITEPQLLKTLKQFEGEILQTPPVYSAIKVKGKKLYEYARKGEEIKIEPRRVFIEKIELKNFDEKNQKAEILIKCSKGTYIRSIANDLGQKFLVGAHLSKLIRTQAGKFFVDLATPLEEIKTIQDVENFLITPLKIINLPQLKINKEEHDKIMNGQAIKIKPCHVMPKRVQHDMDEQQCDPACRTGSQGLFLTYSLCQTSSGRNDTNSLILVYNDKINAIAQINDNQIKVKKVFT